LVPKRTFNFGDDEGDNEGDGGDDNDDAEEGDETSSTHISTYVFTPLQYQRPFFYLKALVHLHVILGHESERPPRPARPRRAPHTVDVLLAISR
jgi:hypothetical protein